MRNTKKKGRVILISHSCLVYCAGEQGYSMVFDPLVACPLLAFRGVAGVCDFQYAKIANISGARPSSLQILFPAKPEGLDV